ncbi:MAG TPA: PepSY-associated TM helix domain-containing protein [Gemmatimonadaceae bacterium]
MTATTHREAPRPAKRAAGRRRTLSRVAFYLHLWLGVITTVALIVISVTGMVLNHKSGLGLMADVPYVPTAPFGQSISLERMAEAALRAAPASATNGWRPEDGVDLSLIDRMDVRPRSGFVKVRLRDLASMEMTVDLASGRVLHTGRRGDVFIERLHSGEAFGSGMILLSDVAALGLVLTLLTGYWLWLVPKLGRGVNGGTE